MIEHKCIEGWSSIVHWGGARFSDFHARYADRVGDVGYVGLETPDGEYYVGWDIESILHPQTMLALREHGEPLDQEHGAPLRLATPNKYGIKTLKRIGVIRYSQRAAGRLLGRAQLRLVRRAVNARATLGSRVGARRSLRWSS